MSLNKLGKDELKIVAEELNLTVPEGANIAGLKSVTVNSDVYKNDKELVQSAIDYALVEIKNKRLDSETKLQFEQIKLAQLQKQLELANIQKNLLQNSDIQNPSVLETAANINVETLLKSVKTLTIPVPSRVESYNLFFQSLEKAFKITEVPEQFKGEILLNILGERVNNLLVHVSEEELNNYIRALQMNEKRWCKAKVDCEVNKNSVFSNVRLEKLNTVVKKDTSAIGNYILVDFNQVNNLLRSAKCQYCEKQTLKLELGAKLGFSYNLKLLCSNCDENKTVVNTSLKSVQTSHDVNLRITQAFSHIGKGYSAIEKFCMVMNIDPFSSTTYGKCARRLDNAYTLASENIFAEIHREIKNVYENGAEITDLNVSFDGTWLTRGHTSLIGVGCVIDMLTGYVVDFEVMSKVCRHCSVAKNKLGQSSAEFSIWYEGHKSECDINHLGSSTSMEMEAALTLWKRSTSLGFRYITVLSDGDCKTFNYLCEKKCMDLTL
ncbi:uncharacterized protein TNCV_145841 [Trichonephila clavipes]|nr:uncharacterized protein TNCV_145841 [Trichonephila clavipes]